MKINDILRAAWPAHRSTRLFPGAVGAILIVCAGCGGNKGDSSRKDAEALFRQQLELTNLFIDSMNHASDSTALLNLYDRFAERMTDCNLSYSPDTDLSILEGENEMLAEMLDSMMRLKEKQLYRYAHPDDSVSARRSADSIPVRPSVPPSRIQHN